LGKCGWINWIIGAHWVQRYGTGTPVARIGRQGRSNAGEPSLTRAFVARIAALEVVNPISRSAATTCCRCARSLQSRG
jgi:hypothetical protein